jgi:hypothetical protein
VKLIEYSTVLVVMNRSPSLTTWSLANSPSGWRSKGGVVVVLRMTGSGCAVIVARRVRQETRAIEALR